MSFGRVGLSVDRRHSPGVGDDRMLLSFNFSEVHYFNVLNNLTE